MVPAVPCADVVVGTVPRIEVVVATELPTWFASYAQLHDDCSLYGACLPARVARDVLCGDAIVVLRRPL